MNIIGEGFPEEIDKQIEIRQSKYGSKSRNNEVLSYLNSKTGWVRMGSSVDVEVNSRGLNLLGSALAKQYVLFNGTSALESGKIPNQRRGITTTNTTHNSSAYGVGGTEQGLTPMPGITQTSIKTETRGLLKTATINIKCHNQTQFDIIDTLYMRLGFTILLEWGHSSYYNNDNVYQSDNEFNLMDTFLGIAKPIPYKNYYLEIAKYRSQSNGNYDALLGKIVNFNWTFNKDGTYDITVILRSMGDVVESLKTNILLPDNSNTDPVIYQPAINPVSIPIWDSAKNLEQANFEQEQLNKLNPQIDNTRQQKNYYDVILLKEEEEIKKVPKVISEEEKINNEGLTGIYANKNANSISKFFYEKINFLNTNTTDGGDDGLSSYSIDGKISFVKQTYVGSLLPQYFIRFGYFLQWLETNIIPNIDDAKLINIDYDIITNIIILANSQVPTDPRICATAYSREFSGGGSTKYLGGGGNSTNTSGETFEEYENGSRYGKIMNIYFNINYINQILQKRTIDGKLVLIDLIKQLCNGWNLSSGNFSRLYPSFDEESNLLKITDENTLPDRDAFLNKSTFGSKSTKLTVFNIYGYTTLDSKTNPASAGFITDFNFQTTISSNLATMITIGSNKNKSIVGEDATGISRMNNGFSDRIKPIITTANITDSSSQKEEEEQLKIDYRKTLETFGNYMAIIGSSNGDPKPQVNTETIDAFKSCVSHLIEYEQNNLVQVKNNNIDIKKNEPGGITNANSFSNNYASANTGFLPFNLSLTMEGLSGFKIYNKFICDTKFLPSNYPSALEFLVSSITNTISNNKWETKIESIAIPQNPYSPSKSVPLLKSKNIIVGNSSYTDRTVTQNFPLNPTGNGGPISNIKTQIVLHYTVSNPKQDLGKGTVAFLNTASQTTKGDRKGLSYHFIMDGNGNICQMVPLNYRAFHATDANHTAIGISIENVGYVKSTIIDGVDTLKLPEGTSQTITDTQGGVVPMVSSDGRTPQPFRGNTYAQEITDGQLIALNALYKDLIERPNKFEGGDKVKIKLPKNVPFDKIYNQLFPASSKTTWTKDNSKNLGGFYTHSSIQTNKSDMSPTPKIVNFFRDLTKGANEKFIEALKLYELIFQDLGDIYTLKDTFGVGLDGKPNDKPLFDPYVVKTFSWNINDNETGALAALSAWWESPKEIAKQQRILQLDPRVYDELYRNFYNVYNSTDNTKKTIIVAPLIFKQGSQSLEDLEKLLGREILVYSINTDIGRTIFG